MSITPPPDADPVAPIREAIAAGMGRADPPLSRYRLAQLSGVTQNRITKFLAGADLSAAAVLRLAAAAGVAVVTVPVPGYAPPRGRRRGEKISPKSVASGL